MNNWEFDKDGKRFLLKAPYNPALNPEFKSAGGKWNATRKRWSFPLDMTSINAVTLLGRQYGCNFVIDPALKTWVQEERKRIANFVAPDDITAVNDDMLPRVKATMPALWNALASRPFQLLGANFIAGQRNVLLADQPGMGKTIQTLAALVENDITGMILVVAPRTAANVTWPNEIRQWLGTDESVTVINGTQKPSERGELIKFFAANAHRTRTGRAFLVCGPNYLRARADLTSDGLRFVRDAKGEKIIRVVNEGRPELFGIEWSAIVVDESHQTLAGATGNLKKQSAQRLGLGLLKTKDNGMRIALSGTPFRGKLHYMWGQIDWLDGERRPAYWNWIERHFGTTKNQFGMVINESLKDEAAFYGELKPMMVRRTKTEVVKDLPEKMYGGTHLDPNDPESPIAVWLDMTPAQKKQYDRMERQAMLEIANEPDMPVNGILAELTRLKQIADGKVTLNGSDIIDSTADSNKIEWIEDFLEDSDGKVIIASQFTKFVYAIAKALEAKGIGYYMITGRQNDAERKIAQDSFQKDGGHRVFLLNTKAGGVSLTLDMADDVIICDKTYNPDDQEQVEDRAHRVSRMHNVTIWNLCSRNTIDETMATVNATREAAAKGVIDGQRGVQFGKQLAEAMRGKAIRKAA